MPPNGHTHSPGSKNDDTDGNNVVGVVVAVWVVVGVVVGVVVVVAVVVGVAVAVAVAVWVAVVVAVVVGVAVVIGIRAAVAFVVSDKDDAILELLRHLRHRSRELNAQADAIEAGNYEVVE